MIRFSTFLLPVALIAACSSSSSDGGQGPGGGGSGDGGAGSDSGAGGGGGGSGDDGGSSGADSGAVVGTLCTNPVFTTTDPNGGYSDSGYYVHNNMWNSSAGLGPETLYACSYHSWYVTSNQTDNAGAVKTYPNVHKDYADVPISSFHALTSTFAETSPHVGIYDVAYDIWTNGVADPNSTEIMIWTDNFKQVPAGDKTTTATFNGVTYDVWRTSDGQYLAFVPGAPMLSGNLDLLAMFKWLQAKSWLGPNATLGQIDFGVEIVDTGGGAATFQFTAFSITSN